MIDDPLARFGPRKPLQKLLYHQTGRNDCIAGGDCTIEGLHLGHLRRRIATERERPNTGVDEQSQSRERSAL